MDQDVGIVQRHPHLLGVGDEIGRKIAAIELHAFDDFQLGLEGLGFLDGDDALVADGLHRLGNHGADLAVAVGGNGADLGNLVVRLDGSGPRLQVFDDRRDGEVDAAFQVHRVKAGSHRLGSFAHDAVGEQRRRRGAVAGFVVGLRGDLADHLGAHILELVFQFDFLGDRHAVLGDARRAEGLVEHNVAAFRAEGNPHRIGQDVDAVQHPRAGVGREFYVFRSHG